MPVGTQNYHASPLLSQIAHLHFFFLHLFIFSFTGSTQQFCCCCFIIIFFACVSTSMSVGAQNYCASPLSRIAHLHLNFFLFFNLFIFSFMDVFRQLCDYFFPPYWFRFPSACKISTFDDSWKVPIFNICLT